MRRMAYMTRTAADDGEVTALLQALVDTRSELFMAMRPLHIRYLQNDIVGLQRQLALLFGKRRGWHLSRSDFSPTVLAREGLFDGLGVHAVAWSHDLVDHGYFYRKDRKAAAVASHLYGEFHEANRRDIDTMAAHLGLKAEWPEDFPSWWVPGGTTLVVYTARKDCAAA
jgi:hypothetical protein